MNPEKEFFNRERKCPVCGKEFMPTVEWVYKRGSGDGVKKYCSWKCFRADERPRAKAESRGTAVMELVMAGKTVKEIAQELGIDTRSVYYWKNKLEKEGTL